MSKLTTVSKLLITLAIVAGVFFGGRWLMGTGLLGGGPKGSVTTLSDEGASGSAKGDILSSAPQNLAGSGLEFQGLPDGEEFRPGKEAEFTVSGIVWNGATSILYANGGSITTDNSFVANYGGPKIRLGVIDDYGLLKQSTIDFALNWTKTGKTDQGSAYTWYMGDNHALYVYDLNSRLKAAGLNVTAEVVAISGYSWGEDQAFGLPEWKEDPQLLHGAVVAVVQGDGDHNLWLQFANDNNIRINTVTLGEGKMTYCKDALNFYYVGTYMEAARSIGLMLEDVAEVGLDGKLTGEKKTARVEGCGTWTPGDAEALKAAEEKGITLVSLFSTRQNAYQMPCVIVGIKEFNQKNGVKIQKFVDAVFSSGDQLKTYRQAFDYAMGLNAKFFNLNDAAYWASMFNGAPHKNADGSTIILGGTRISNYADNVDALGGSGKSRQTFKSSYEKFGGYVAKLYPDLLPKVPAYSDVVTTRFISGTVYHKADATHQVAEGFTPSYDKKTATETFGNKQYSIEFKSGKADFGPGATRVLEQMFDDLNTSDLLIEIEGHTDNVGSDAVNIPLSQARADAVRLWLMGKSPKGFPSERFINVVGKGSTEPVDPDAVNTEAGRAKNRRVEIVTSGQK